MNFSTQKEDISAVNANERDAVASNAAKYQHQIYTEKLEKE
tara:strand:- start:261 stop:383 length:123 start_codon:yes stop_codon:yes gene_type:complete